ncbi:hypothetical protein PMAYCL1PPCAC_01960 [Pristionchus mayeri]|uniref:Secreted protein n=1 Tax=Pristionchus mayeri TaxID=1317129 RepID=A0AAN4Z5T5_9BILA|nr:hypothetical protein PMAYCL1PPCAC_01960 [Pristionchus mayeri]
MRTLIFLMHWPVAMSHTRTILSVAHEKRYLPPSPTCILEVLARVCWGTEETRALLSKRPLFAASRKVNEHTIGGYDGQRRPLECINLHQLWSVELPLDVVGRRVASTTSRHFHDI